MVTSPSKPANRTGCLLSCTLLILRKFWHHHFWGFINLHWNSHTILFLHNQSFVLWLGILRRKKFPLKNFGKGISPIYWSVFNSFLKSTIQSFWTPNMFLNALSNFCASDIFDMDFTSWCLNALSLILDICNSEHQSISGYKCLFAVDGFSRVKLQPRIPPLSLVW